MATFHFDQGGCEVRRAGRLLLLLCRGDGNAASDQLSESSAGEILDEIGRVFRIFFRGGLEEWACEVLPGQEYLFHRKVGALLARILTVITTGRKGTQNQGVVWSCQKRFVSREELLITKRAAWSCLRHVDTVGVTFRNGDEVLFSTLADVELRALQYFDLSLNPLPYRKRDLGFEMPSGTTLFQLHDAEDWIAGRRFSVEEDIASGSGKYQFAFFFNSFHSRDYDNFSQFVNSHGANDSLNSTDQIGPINASKDRERLIILGTTRLPQLSEFEEAAEAMRELLYKASFSREAASKSKRSSKSEQEALLFVQKVAHFQMLVLLRSRELHKSVIFDLWNIGLQKLSRLIGLSFM